ncbi:MAG TPA: DUF2207 domain-containing protein [Mogibacterium sp.]|nr:DUF2207 domain-containing protein [Mogibacterium sp.]
MLKKRYNTRNTIIIALAIFCGAILILALLKSKLNLPYLIPELIGLLIAVTLVIVVTSLTTGRDAVIVNEPSEYPPENITPSQAGCIQDGLIDTREIVSAIFFLAQKGYFVIREYELHQFEFIYGKYPMQEDRSMRLLFNGIFGKAKEGDIVKLIDARERLVKILPEFKKLVIKSIVSKKNKEIAVLTGKVNGFIETIINNSQERYADLVKEDKEYLYKIIPYAYVFTIASKLPSKFEKIYVDNPDWYLPYGTEDGYNFDVVIYNSMLRNLPNQFNNLIIKG